MGVWTPSHIWIDTPKVIQFLSRCKGNKKHPCFSWLISGNSSQICLKSSLLVTFSESQWMAVFRNGIFTLIASWPSKKWDPGSNKLHRRVPSLKPTANARENEPKPKRKPSSSNHQFSGDILVFRSVTSCNFKSSTLHHTSSVPPMAQPLS